MPNWIGRSIFKPCLPDLGACVYDDPMGELMSLRQQGSVQEFQDSFEELLNRVELPESYAISCFLSGLKEEIQLAVRMFMPKTLSHTYCLAKLEELKIQAAKKNRPSEGKSFQSFPKMEYFTGGSIVDSPRKTNGGNSEKASSHLERSGDG